MSYHEDRAEFTAAVRKLARFIHKRTELPALKCQTLAMEIVSDSVTSGVVPAARAIRLLNEAL